MASFWDTGGLIAECAWLHYSRITKIVWLVGEHHINGDANNGWVYDIWHIRRPVTRLRQGDRHGSREHSTSKLLWSQKYEDILLVQNLPCDTALVAVEA